jgi:hypothetical protein
LGAWDIRRLAALETSGFFHSIGLGHYHYHYHYREAVHGRLRKGKGAIVDQGSLPCGPIWSGSCRPPFTQLWRGAATQLHNSKLETRNHCCMHLVSTHLTRHRSRTLPTSRISVCFSPLPFTLLRLEIMVYINTTAKAN